MTAEYQSLKIILLNLLFFILVFASHFFGLLFDAIYAYTCFVILMRWYFYNYKMSLFTNRNISCFKVYFVWYGYNHSSYLVVAVWNVFLYFMSAPIYLHPLHYCWYIWNYIFHFTFCFLYVLCCLVLLFLFYCFLLH